MLLLFGITWMPMMDDEKNSLVGMESLSGGIENYIREHALFT